MEGDRETPSQKTSIEDTYNKVINKCPLNYDNIYLKYEEQKSQFSYIPPQLRVPLRDLFKSLLMIIITASEIGYLFQLLDHKIFNIVLLACNINFTRGITFIWGIRESATQLITATPPGDGTLTDYWWCRSPDRNMDGWTVGNA